MQSINLSKIIADLKLNALDLAKELYPRHKHPSVALKWAIRQVHPLDAIQISKLSSITGIPIAQLFDGGWKVQSKAEIITFSTKNYRAELNTTEWVTRVYKNGYLVHECLIHDKKIALSDYLTWLEETILEK